MKKRYIATPLLLLSIAAVWNISLRAHTPHATAEEIKSYTTPQASDTRHPIDVFTVPISGGETESAVLAGLNTTIYPEDKVTFVIDPMLGLGTIVHIERALPITVQDGKRTLQIHTWANTVDELLNDINRPLAPLDKTNYKPSDTLATNMTIVVTRVSKTQISTKEVIAFETVTQEDPNEYRGVTKTKQDGVNGERTKTFEVTREDGEEVSRKLIKNEVTKPVQNKIIIKGTKIKYGRSVSGSATYYPTFNACEANRSANREVAMNQLPKGTVVEVTNNSNGQKIIVTVDDTGAFPNTTAIDLAPRFFKQLGGTCGMGRIQSVTVREVLNP
jgi:rare lipoprotein A (peptidoglycan hydrolase)